MADTDTEIAVLNNLLIVGNICKYLEKNDLLKLRTVSKVFDDACERIFTKRGYGRWINGKKYFEHVEKLLEESRHPEIFKGKIKINGKKKNNNPDSDSKFREMVASNLEHVQSLRLDDCLFEDVISILNDCKKLVELRYSLDISNLPDVDDDPDLLERMAFDFKNLSRFELKIGGELDGPELVRKKSVLDHFIKKIITASDKITLLSIQGWRLSQHLKAIVEDSEICKKLESLKTLHVNYPGLALYRPEKARADQEIIQGNDYYLFKLLLLVRNSIEDLHIGHVTYPISSGLSRQWPQMPNLTTISFGNYLQVPENSSLPRKVQAPKLKLLLLLVTTEHSIWRQGVKNSWARQLGLDKKIKLNENGQQSNERESGRAPTVVLMSGCYADFWSEPVLRLLEGVKVAQLVLNMKDVDLRDSGAFLLECTHYIPSLTRLIVRTEYMQDIKILDIPLINLCQRNLYMSDNRRFRRSRW